MLCDCFLKRFTQNLATVQENKYNVLSVEAEFCEEKKIVEGAKPLLRQFMFCNFC